MEKVKVNSKLYKQLKEAYFWLGSNNVKRKLINAFYNQFGDFENFECDEIIKLEENELYKILANGFELEESKEEKLLNFFMENKYYADCFGVGVCEGIFKTLELLEIKIEGINK